MTMARGISVQPDCASPAPRNRPSLNPDRTPDLEDLAPISEALMRGQLCRSQGHRGRIYSQQSSLGCEAPLMPD